MTIKDIANIAGVSISTVSKIVNNKDQNINPETRRRVLKVVKEYNYTPYGTVKNISHSKKFLLGILVKNSIYSITMLNGIQQAAQENGYSTIFLNSYDSPETEEKHITTLCANNVDGVIWERVSLENDNTHHFNKQGIPFITINENDVNSYHIDYSHIGYCLTKKLVDLKHTKLALINTRKEEKYCVQFLDGFKRCLFDNQIIYGDDSIYNSFDPESLQALIRNKVTGIVTTDFSTSVDIYGQLDKHQYHIPEDISLVSLKMDMHESITYPAISGFCIPYFSFGYYICKQLVEICEKSNENDVRNLSFIGETTFDHMKSAMEPSFIRRKRIVVVGSIHMDSTFNVSVLPQAGKTVPILNSAISIGGKGANQAIGIARLGHEVSLIGEVGRDTDSAFILDALEKENVISNGIFRDQEKQTGKAYIYIEKDGESAITVLSGANNSLTPSHINERQPLFKNAGFCLVSTEIPLDTVIRVADIARQNKAKIILKPAALKELPSQLAHNTDIFVPNRKEASVLCPILDTIEEQAEYFYNQGIPIVIITLGSKGCFLKTADLTRYFSAADVISVDTTGGADAFISALASYLTAGFSLEKAIQIAIHAAGFCVSRQGVVPALIDRNTLEAHIAQKAPHLLQPSFNQSNLQYDIS